MAWLKCRCDDHIFYEEHTLVRRYVLRQHDGQCTLQLYTDNDACHLVFGKTLEEAEDKLDFMLELVRNPDILTVDLANFTIYPGIRDELRELEKEMQSRLESPKFVGKYASLRRKHATFC